MSKSPFIWDLSNWPWPESHISLSWRRITAQDAPKWKTGRQFPQQWGGNWGGRFHLPLKNIFFSLYKFSSFMLRRLCFSQSASIESDLWWISFTMDFLGNKHPILNFTSSWVVDGQNLANYWLGFKELNNIQANQVFQSQSELYSGFIRIDVWNKLHYLGKRLANTVDNLYCCLQAEEISVRSFILVTQHSNLSSDKLVYWRETLFCLHSKI